MFRILIEEYENYAKHNKNNKLLRAIICYFRALNFRVVVLIKYMQQNKTMFFKRMIQKKLKMKYMVDIGLNASFGEKFSVEHYMGLVIGDRVIIGNNCKVYHDVTIGQKNGKYPKVGNNVTIYPGAKILGNINIGNNVIVAANSVVINDVPDNSIVAGIPGEIKKKMEKN